jgi:hypothetical protein
MINRVKLREALEMLYTARWNIPQAANHCELSHQEMKEIFSREALVGGLLPQKGGIPTMIQLSLGL